jgi:multiple sugar transport system ATP-binding protein
MASLTIKNVHKRYGSVQVLKGIDIALNDGEFLVLVGPSGCGKSTLLNIIAGLDDATEGELYIGDRLVNKVHPRDRNIAMVFQSYALYPNMNVRKNITFGLEMRKVPKKEQDELVTKVSRMLKIEHLLDRKPAQLSGGQRQRVAMGRALARQPEIFLFDEPLSNLDAKLRVEMRIEIKRLHQRLGTTIVYVTHDQIEAMTLADKIALMEGGVVQQLADPQTIYESPSNMFVAGFIGSPSMNFIPATITSRANGLILNISTEGGEALQVPLYNLADSYRSWMDCKVIVGIRPENITHRLTFEKQSKQYHDFESLVHILEPTGPDTMVVISLGGTEVMARVSPKEVVPPGQKMRFTIDTSKIILFDPDTQKRI